LPGMVIGSLVGIAGQGVYGDVTRWVQHRRDSPKPAQPMWKRVLSHKWSPMKLLTDEEYAEHMNRKLLKTEADIALLDDRIQELEDSQSSGDSSPSETKRKDP
jgi:BMFP domain-containing protein YqiC